MIKDDHTLGDRKPPTLAECARLAATLPLVPAGDLEKYPHVGIADILEAKGGPKGMEYLAEQARHRGKDGKFYWEYGTHMLEPELPGKMTTTEILMVDHGSVIQFSHEMEAFVNAIPLYHLFWKLGNSQWRWGYKDSWNDKVLGLAGIGRFDGGIPGMEFFIDRSTYCNEFSHSHHLRKYVDGCLGLMGFWKGELSLVIGFSLCGDRRIVLNQVQCVGKGNRWLYKVKGSLFAHVWRRLKAAFPEFEVLVPIGRDQATSLAKRYRHDDPLRRKFMDEQFDRIRRLYSTKVPGYHRSPEVVRHVFGVRYKRLVASRLEMAA